MGDANRKLLKKDTCIELYELKYIYKEDKIEWFADQGKVDFLIEGLENVGEKDKSKAQGASGVCYYAKKEGQQRGRLKEIYPESKDILRIHHDLIPQAEVFYKSFVKECENTRDSYYEIMNLRNTIRGSSINNFIPKFQFFVSKVHKDVYKDICEVKYDEEGYVNNGLYVWYENDWDGITFHDYLKHYIGKSKKTATRDLLQVIKIVKSLAQCVQTLHNLGYVHMDIKPSNFLLTYLDKPNKIINPQQISLFDLDSIKKQGTIIVNRCLPNKMFEDSLNENEIFRDSIRFTEGFYKQDDIEDLGAIVVDPDIYAICQTLIYAMSGQCSTSIYTGSQKNNKYKWFFNQFKNGLLSSSQILNSYMNYLNDKDENLEMSEQINQNGKNDLEYHRICFMNQLIHIIHKALTYDYDNTKLLVDDLGILEELAEKLYQNHIVIEYSKEKTASAKTLIQTTLYNDPLYHHYDERNNQFIDFVLVGFGNYGQTFMKVAMEMSQMIYRNNDNELDYVIPRFKIFTKKKEVVDGNEIDVIETFFKQHPSFKDFIMVDGVKPNKVMGKEMLGIVDFIDLNIDVDHIEDSVRFIRENIKKPSRMYENKMINEKLKEDFKSNVFFVALGNDQMNYDVINSLRKNGINEEDSKRVFYFAREQKDERQRYRKVTPIYINNFKLSEDENELLKNLKRMAFNAHLVWDKKTIRNIQKMYKEFLKDSYSLDSSLSNALTIKYKLHSVGIDDSDPIVAAFAFEDKVLANQDQSDAISQEKKKVQRKLVACEHRRWLIEKINDGFKDYRDQDGNVIFQLGKHQDKKDKFHVCMEKSNADIKLSNIEGDVLYPKWDSAIKGLDPLDQVSYDYHQFNVGMAKKCGVIDFTLIEDQMYEASNDLKRYYQQYMYCINNIKNDGKRYAHSYETYYDNFKDAIENSNLSNKELLIATLQRIHKQFEPILQANIYIDFKANDISLIRQIPFILTYRHDLKFATTLQLGSKSDIFQNVAVLSWLQPNEITYYYHLNGFAIFEKNQMKITEMIDALKGMKLYMKERKISTNVKVKILCSDMNRNFVRYFIDEMQSVYRKEVIFPMEIIIFDFGEDVIKTEYDQFDLKIMKMNKDHRNGYLGYLINDLNQNAHYFQYHLDILSSQVYRYMQEHDQEQFEFIGFRYDALNNKLIDDQNILKFIPKNTYLRIFDAYRLSNAYETKVEPPEHYYEYKEIWNLYKKHKDEYKSFCDRLKKGSDIVDKVISLDLNSVDDVEMDVYQIVLPNFTHTSVKALLNQLMNKKHQVIDHFEIRFHQQSTYQVDITHKKEKAKEFELDTKSIDLRVKEHEIYTKTLPNYTKNCVEELMKKLSQDNVLVIREYEMISLMDSQYTLKIKHAKDTLGHRKIANYLDSIFMEPTLLKNKEAAKIKVNGKQVKVSIEPYRKASIRSFFDKIFDDLYLLCNVEDLKVECREGVLKVMIETLKGCIEGDGQEISQNKQVIFNDVEQEIFETLVKKRFILNVKDDVKYYTSDGELKMKPVKYFNYISKEMKKILNTVGAILEYYLYYKVKQIDYFDDILSCEVLWLDDRLRNEFDAVLTKGNRMMFVECKMKANSSDFYYKLNTLGSCFGINYCGVIVVDDHSKESIELRGTNVKIYTISKDDIENIGKKLKEIMELEIQGGN